MINKDKYALYIGRADDILDIKTANGFSYWRKDDCVAEITFTGNMVSTGQPVMTLKEAWDKGARKLILGIATPGGKINQEDFAPICDALGIGYTIVSGLHMKLAEIPAILNHPDYKAEKVIELRNGGKKIMATGEKRQGNRLLTVGTDCCVGKMFTALSIHAGLQQRGIKSTFRATGQTGMMIAESGICADAIINDFLPGNIEELSPSNDSDHWDIIEGQGSLFNPVAVCIELLHASQPDALVVCHEWGRKIMDGTRNHPMPQLQEVIDLNLTFARMTNPHAKVIGISMNTRRTDKKTAELICRETEDLYGLPCEDIVRHGSDRLLPNESNEKHS